MKTENIVSLGITSSRASTPRPTPSVPLNREPVLAFAPETLLPSQLPQAGDELGNRAGVKGLMLAILEDAVYCLTDVSSHCAKRRHEARKAEAWIRQSGDDWLFSFDSICRVLDLEPESLRYRLLSVPPEEAVPGEGRRRRSHRVERGKRKRRTREALERIDENMDAEESSLAAVG